MSFRSLISNSIAIIVCCFSINAAAAGDTIRLTFFEVSSQVYVEQGQAFSIPEFIPAPVEIGSTILLNANLIRGGELLSEPFPRIEGGKNIGVMNGFCKTTGQDLKLSQDPNEPLGLIAQCQQTYRFHQRGSVSFGGSINQTAFEQGIPQLLSVYGGTREFSGVRGQVKITQVVFPGFIKKVKLKMTLSRRR